MSLYYNTNVKPQNLETMSMFCFKDKACIKNLFYLSMKNWVTTYNIEMEKILHDSDIKKSDE